MGMFVPGQHGTAFNSGNLISSLIPLFSLLSSSRDSTYRDDDGRPLDEQLLQSNGIQTKIMKSSSCSSFLVDVLMKGIVHHRISFYLYDNNGVL